MYKKLWEKRKPSLHYLDKIVDILKYNARDALTYKGKYSKETIAICEQVNKSVRAYYELFYTFDHTRVLQLSKNRDHVKVLIKHATRSLPRDDIVYITNMKQILEIILDLTDFRMGLEY